MQSGLINVLRVPHLVEHCTGIPNAVGSIATVARSIYFFSKC